MNMYFSILLFLSLSLGLAGCIDRKYENPNDPNRENKVATSTDKIGGAQADPSSSSPTASSPSSPPTPTQPTSVAPSVPAPAGSAPTVESPAAGCLVAGCSPAAGTVFDISNAFETTPAGCAEAKRSMVFDAGGGKLQHFVQANCGSRQHVYSFQTNYDGTAASAPVTLTAQCNTGSTGAETFEADKGADGYLIAYVCYVDTSHRNLRMVAVDSSGAATGDTLFENAYDSSVSGTNHKPFKIAWNATAGSYGLARNDKFQRFSAVGVAQGGPVTIGGSSFVAGISVDGGNWIFTTGINQSACYKVSSSGTLLCNGTSLGWLTFPIAGNSSFMVNNYYRNKLQLLAFNASNCSTTDADDGIAPVNELDNNSNGIFEAEMLTAKFAAVLYRSDPDKLVAAIISADDKFSIESESPITQYQTSLDSAHLAVINGRIYTDYTKDGKAYVSYSTQSVSN